MKLSKRIFASTAVAGLAAAAVALPASAGMGPSATVSASVTGSTAVVTAKLAHFKIDAKDVGMKNMAGMGHLHFPVSYTHLTLPTNREV